MIVTAGRRVWIRLVAAVALSAAACSSGSKLSQAKAREICRGFAAQHDHQLVASSCSTIADAEATLPDANRLVLPAGMNSSTWVAVCGVQDPPSSSTGVLNLYSNPTQYLVSRDGAWSTLFGPVPPTTHCTLGRSYKTLPTC